MSEPIISVQGLGKKYTLGANRERYVALRDVLARQFTRLFRRPAAETVPPPEEFWALQDVSFDIHPGEVVGIIGRNGAGKSTLLKILSRITEPTRGRVTIAGRVASLLEVGTGFHPELTGRENIYLNGAILGMSRHEIKKKFDEIVAFAEVERFLDTPVKRYSSGMYVRLAFAVAAHLEPEILIIDEVLAVGDAQFQKKCLGKMQDVSTREGRTVLFVSHNMAAVSQLCTGAILMDKGRLAKQGSMEDVAAIYTSSFQGNESFNLDQREDREGEGQTRFMRLWIEDVDGAVRDQISSGETMMISAEYKSQEESALKNFLVSFVITDVLGQILFLFSTELTAPDAQAIPANGTLRCIVPRLPLSGGFYQIGCHLRVNGVIQDNINHAGRLEVVDGNFYGTGRLYPPGWQGRGVLVEHKWLLPVLPG